MSDDQLRKAAAMVGGNRLSEASGNVSPTTVRALTETGVDNISTGALTDHSALQIHHKPADFLNGLLHVADNKFTVTLS